MPNFAAALNEQIRRLSRREAKSQTKVIKKLTAQYRRSIAALKREIASLKRSVAFLDRQEKKRGSASAALPKAEGLRFRADGLRTHRAKLGLSALDYGKLVGVSGLTVYHWEAGKSRPRRQQLAKLALVRGIGKREAMKRLEAMN